MKHHTRDHTCDENMRTNRVTHACDEKKSRITATVTRSWPHAPCKMQMSIEMTLCWCDTNFFSRSNILSFHWLVIISSTRSGVHYSYKPTDPKLSSDPISYLYFYANLCKFLLKYANLYKFVCKFVCTFFDYAQKPYGMSKKIFDRNSKVKPSSLNV